MEESDGAREESVEVMTKWKMWFLLWVKKFTCWLRLKEERRDKNWEVRWSVGLTRCMSESPVMMNSWGVIAAKDRKELKSSTKMENGLESQPASLVNIHDWVCCCLSVGHLLIAILYLVYWILATQLVTRVAVVSSSIVSVSCRQCTFIAALQRFPLSLVWIIDTSETS